MCAWYDRETLPLDEEAVTLHVCVVPPGEPTHSNEPLALEEERPPQGPVQLTETEDAAPVLQLKLTWHMPSGDTYAQSEIITSVTSYPYDSDEV